MVRLHRDWGDRGNRRRGLSVVEQADGSYITVRMQEGEAYPMLYQELGNRATVDLESMTVKGQDGLAIPFQLDPFRRRCLMEGLDDIGLTLAQEASIDAFEATRAPYKPQTLPIRS